jgi:hypothetical protein
MLPVISKGGEVEQYGQASILHASLSAFAKDHLLVEDPVVLCGARGGMRK